MSQIPALRSRTRHRGVNREKIFYAAEPAGEILREDDRSAKDFAGMAARAEPHAASSLLRFKIAVPANARSMPPMAGGELPRSAAPAGAGQ
jgi:hypothetical protein